MTRKRSAIDSLSHWVGSWPFFILHIIWFATWFLLSKNINLLTLIVSLEAIILMILLLMQQNRQVDRDNRRDESDYRIDLKTKNIAQQNKEVLTDLKRQMTKLTHLLKKDDKSR